VLQDDAPVHQSKKFRAAIVECGFRTWTTAQTWHPVSIFYSYIWRNFCVNVEFQDKCMVIMAWKDRIPTLTGPEYHIKLTRSSATAQGPRDALWNSCYVSQCMESERLQTAKVTFNVIQGHWQRCHSIGHIRFPIRLPLQPCLYIAPFPRYYHLGYIPKFKDSTWRWTRTFRQ